MILTSLIFISNAHAKKKVDTSLPVTGTGRIVKINSGDRYWMRLDNEGEDGFDKTLKDFDDRAKNSTFRFQGVPLIRVQLINISSNYERLPKKHWTKVSPVIEEAAIFASKKLYNSAVDFECFGPDDKDEILCAIYQDGHDFGYSMLVKGFSEYIKKYGLRDTYHDEYEKAQELAISKKVGIWKPFYFFQYPKSQP